jgi:hypothetical protein
MSSRWLGLSLGAVLSLSAPLAAQDSLAILRGMEARLDSLQLRAKRADSAVYRSSSTDTVVVGGLRISTSAALRPMVESAAAEAWGNLRSRFGASIEAQGPLPVARFGGPDASLPSTYKQRELIRGLEGTVRYAMLDRMDTQFSRWLSVKSPRFGESVDAYRIQIVGEMVGRPARPNVACLGGDAEACAVALGLRAAPDTLVEWFLPETWPRLAGMLEGELSARDRLARERCMGARDLAACHAVLTPGRVRPPVSFYGRLYLVGLALDAGGQGAFDRLVADTGAAVEQRLAAAAGMPADSLLTKWAGAVRSAFPGSPLPRQGEAIVTLAWSIAILTLAARGSRWR